MFHPQYADTVRRLEEALNSPRLMVFGRVNKWLEDGATPEEIIDVCTRIAKQGNWAGNNLGYFDRPIAQSIADRTKPLPKAAPRDHANGARRPADKSYEPPADLPTDARDAIDKGNARLMNLGINVMTVTYQDAERMFRKGWLTPQAAERWGLKNIIAH